MNILNFLNGNRNEQWKCFGTFGLLICPVVFLAIFYRHQPGIFYMVNLAIGFFAWTYFEYHLHRFWTHNKNGSSREGLVDRHVYHHTRPTEIKVTRTNRVALFLISCLLLTTAYYLNDYFTIAAGFLSGFAYSFYSHWMLHQKWSRRIFPHLHRFHIHHHSKHTDKCFGFTTTLWDRVFGTTPPANAHIPERIVKFYYGELPKNKNPERL